MRKILAISILCFSLLTATAQNFTNIEKINEGWDKKTITGVKDGSILSLATAFNKVWPTRPTTDLLKNPVSNDGEGDYEIIVDSPNGYVSAFELGDDGESFSACVWKRNNGHRLFAYVFQRMHGLSISQIILFYDYDPAKATLTPERNELTNFASSFTTDYHPLTYQLPQKGKDVVVNEYFMNWYCSIAHNYKWDGMNLKFSDVKIDKFDQMRRLYSDDFDEFEDSDFTKFMLYDFDDDNNPEVWLSSQNEEYQAIYSIVADEVQMLSATYFKTNFSFYENGICTSGGCGTGCFYSKCVMLNESKVFRTCEEFQSYNFETDGIDVSYTIDGQEVSVEEGEKMFKSLGNSIEITPKFRAIR